eukprot:scaffold328770_cov80-Tisochrysis_lutea.AAC.1
MGDETTSPAEELKNEGNKLFQASCCRCTSPDPLPVSRGLTSTSGTHRVDAITKLLRSTTMQLS